MYGTIWSLNMRFDTRFFVISSCFLSYLEELLMDLGIAMRHLTNYITAVRRIQVSVEKLLRVQRSFFPFRHFLCWKNRMGIH